MRRLVYWLLCLSLVSCEDHEFHPPDRAAQVAEADTVYRRERFDTISWTSEAERLRTGNLVYVEHCRRCHGSVGEGNTDYAREHDLKVPSLVQPNWRYVDQPDSIRHRIFVGHVQGMPTWGIAGITLREIDAVTGYVLSQLR